jgi:hypothetical protein
MADETPPSTDDYPIEILESGGRYLCVVRPLLISASHEDLNTAYEEVRTRRDSLVKDARTAGLFRDSGRSHSEVEFAGTGNAIAAFAIRTSIVSVAAAVLLILAGVVASTASRKAANAFISRLESYSIFNNWDERNVAFQEWLFAAAAPRNEPTPAQQAKIKESVRILVSRLRPYVDEVRPLLNDPRETTPNPPDPSKKN